jgi:alginate O-acetyltransferase complex protein AlgI
MIFTDFFFFIFLVVSLIIANLLLKDKPRRRIFFLTIISYFFYATNNWKFAAILLGSTIVNFYLGKLLARSSDPKRFVVVSVLFNLSILAY